MATTPANIYGTIQDIEDVIGVAGVALASDDTSPTAYGAAMAKAGNRIDLYLLRFYTPQQLMQSDMVKDWWAILGAYYLRTRRGNSPPPGLAEMYTAAVAELKEIKMGQNDVPGIARRKSYAPGMSKMRATQRPYPRAVVETSQGTTAGGRPAGFQEHADVYDVYGFNAQAFLDYCF